MFPLVSVLLFTAMAPLYNKLNDYQARKRRWT